MSELEDFLRRNGFPCWCGQAEARSVCHQLFGRRPFAVLECRVCGTHRILPKALSDQRAAETLYNEYYAPELCESERDKSGRLMLKRLAETGVTFSRTARVLDVGCGNGVLLNTVCQEFGCSGRGIDVDRRRIEQARADSKGATFECGLFNAAAITEVFDVVVANAVIEHVVDPTQFLEQLGQVLRLGGSLFLLTPNASSVNYRLLCSWWRELLSIGEHIYLFTPASLEQCAKGAGLTLVTCSSGFDWNRSRLSFNSLRDSTLSLWACYRELVKRASSVIASPRTGDILYAHYRKSQKL